MHRIALIKLLATEILKATWFIQPGHFCGDRMMSQLCLFVLRVGLRPEVYGDCCVPGPQSELGYVVTQTCQGEMSEYF